MVSTLLGYDLGVIAGAIPHVQRYYLLSDTQLEMFVGCFGIFQALATGLGAVLGDSFGRRFVLSASCLLATVGTITLTLASAYQWLLFGRMVTGTGVGAGLALAPTYLAELAPQRQRGAILALLEVYINVGILLGFMAGAVFGRLSAPLNFRIMFGLGALPCVAILGAMYWMPESPRWLLMKGRDDEGLAVLETTCEDGTEIQVTYDEMLEEVRASQGYGLWDIFSAKSRPAMTVAFGLAIIFACTMVDAVTYYSTMILKASGESDDHTANIYCVWLSAFKTTTILISSTLVDRIGRKPLIIVSLMGMCLAMSVPVVIGLKHQLPLLTLVGLLAFLCSFGLGLGPGFYILSTEVWPLRLRAVGTASAHFVRSIICAVINIHFLSFVDMGGWSGIMGCAGMFGGLGILFVLYNVPETAGQTLEEASSKEQLNGVARYVEKESQPLLATRN